THSAAFETLQAGHTLTDTFVYTVTDGHGVASATVTVAVTVPASDAPTTTLATTATNEDSSIAGSLAANVGFDADDPITFTAQTITTADGATVTIGTNGNYTYNPNGSTAFETLAFGSTLTDSFTYT